jgi:hypothetical protein
MGLRDKYTHAIQTAKNLRFDGSAQEEGGRLYFRGTANAYNRIFDANRDQLTDPDEIRPGQVLKIPA